MTKLIVALLAMILQPAYLFAVDGQVLINQAALNIAGGTYTITQPGSYKLSGNLQAKDQNTSVIVIATDRVAIDLNGFSISGPVDCSGGFPCKNLGFGIGIVTQEFGTKDFFNITIRNGTIEGMGDEGIWVFGDSVLVENMHLRRNGRDGIAISKSAGQQFNVIVQHNNVQQNGGIGIVTNSGQVTDNVVTESQLFGILIGRALNTVLLPTGTVARNVVTNNGFGGLLLEGSVSYIGNAMSGNGPGAQVTGGFNQGQNLCGAGACPGAVF